MKLSRLNRLLRHRAMALLATAAVLAAAAALAFAIRSATSQGGGQGPGAADFTRITPSPYYVTTPTFLDWANMSHCQLPDNERPRPDLPPLSCRNSGAEPPPGTIPTVNPSVARTAPTAPAGFKVIDNPLFRFTVQIPDTWYSNMRPEGGEFYATDPIATQEAATGHSLPGGGVGVFFSGSAYVPPRVPDGFQGDIELRLKHPTVSFAGAPGVIWDEGPGEGKAHQIRAAFLKDGVVCEVWANVEDDGRSGPDIQVDVDAVNAVIASITPY